MRQGTAAFNRHRSASLRGSFRFLQDFRLPFGGQPRGGSFHLRRAMQVPLLLRLASISRGAAVKFIAPDPLLIDTR